MQPFIVENCKVMEFHSSSRGHILKYNDCCHTLHEETSFLSQFTTAEAGPRRVFGELTILTQRCCYTSRPIHPAHHLRIRIIIWGFPD